MKPSIPLPALVLGKLLFNICAQTKDNGGILRITNICQIFPARKHPGHITKEKGVPRLPSAKVQRAALHFPSSQPVRSELMPKAGRSREEQKTFAKHPLIICIVSLSFYNDCLMYLLLSPFRAENESFGSFSGQSLTSYSW